MSGSSMTGSEYTNHTRSDMGNEFNQLISEDLAEISGPILRKLIAEGNCNLRGVGALLQLAACILADSVERLPSAEDHKLSSKVCAVLGDNTYAAISFLAQMAKACTLVHSGYKGVRDGSV